MKPSLGRIVIVKTLEDFNGNAIHPAIVNRVWSTNDPGEARGAHACINVTVLPDCGKPFSMTSLSLYETQEEALESGNNHVAWWPERV